MKNKDKKEKEKRKLSVDLDQLEEERLNACANSYGGA